MTWSWSIFKFATTTGLGMLSVNPNPIGWGIGLYLSQETILCAEDVLDDYDLGFDDKVGALRTSQWATDYRNGLTLGAIATGVGSVASSVTHQIGKEAGREIAKNGGKFTRVALQLIIEGKQIAKTEKFFLQALKYSAWKDDISDLFVEITKDVKEGERFLEATDLILEAIRQEMLASRNINDLANFRKNLLKINRQNISIYVLNGRNYDQHSEVNEKLNKLLRILKRYTERVERWNAKRNRR